MFVQSHIQLVPSVRVYDPERKESSNIDGIDVLEVTQISSALLAEHTGESGMVYADTRVILPARFRALIVIPEFGEGGGDVAIENLLDASSLAGVFYTIRTFFSTCFNVAVESSVRKDAPNMMNLRVQEVVFKECIVPDSISDHMDDLTFMDYDDFPYQVSPGFAIPLPKETADVDLEA